MVGPASSALPTRTVPGCVGDPHGLSEGSLRRLDEHRPGARHGRGVDRLDVDGVALQQVVGRRHAQLGIADHHRSDDCIPIANRNAALSDGAPSSPFGQRDFRLSYPAQNTGYATLFRCTEDELEVGLWGSSPGRRATIPTSGIEGFLTVWSGSGTFVDVASADQNTVRVS